VSASIRDPLFSGWRYRALLYSVLLSALGYLAFSWFGGWRDVVEAISRIGLAGVLLALGLSLLNYGLRFLRWQTYLRTLGHRVPWEHSLQIYLAGFALTTTPGKAGEAFRGVLLKRRGVPYPDSLAAFFSERLSDLLAIVLLTLFGLTLYPEARALILMGALLTLIALAGLSHRGWMLRWRARLALRPKLGAYVRHLFDVLLQARQCHRPTVLLAATLLSVIGWGAEALAFFMMLYWLGLEVPLGFAVFVFALSMLAGALSLMPGGLGSTEGVMAALLIWHGVGAPDAIAATVLIRLTTLWFAVGIGLVAVSTGSLRTSRSR
jgi:uncharacterized membrane protein YbhN (UPF0104 family)